MDKQKGVTLVETVVVSLIFILLCSIALPLVGRSLDEGNKASDLSNLRQLGKALALYTSEYDAVQYDVDVLVASGHASKAIVTSSKDGSSKGLSRLIRRNFDINKWKQRKDGASGVNRSFHRSFASLNDFGFDAPHAMKLIADEDHFGWCINPSYIAGVDHSGVENWNGFYQRLLVDGSVVSSRVKHYSINGGTLTTPLSLFAEVGNKWLQNFIDN